MVFCHAKRWVFSQPSRPSTKNIFQEHSMRINIYHEELTNEAEIVWTEPRPGVRYCGLRIFQKSAKELHNRPGDDDRSAITFWCGTLGEVEELLTALHKVLK